MADERIGELSDLEITRLCAEAMDYQLGEMIAPVRHAPPQQMVFMDGASYHTPYNPLHDDAQCFALGKKFPDLFSMAVQEWAWQINRVGNTGYSLNHDLCRRIARAQLAKGRG